MDGMTRLPQQRTTASQRLGGPPALSATGYPWADGDILYAADLNAAFNQVGANVSQDIGRNFLHNPLFNVAQRGLGPFTFATYTADRWFTAGQGCSGTTNIFQNSALASTDEAIERQVNNTFTGTSAAGDTYQFIQHIEDVRRLSGKTVTVSFWASTGTGSLNLGVVLSQHFGNGGSPSGDVLTAQQLVVTTASFQRFTLTFALPPASGKTFGSTAGTDFTGLIFIMSQQGQAVGVQSGTIALAGVQLEVGSVATPLEKPDPRYDVSNCQRFLQAGSFWLAGCGVAGNVFGYGVPFMVPMRAVPTCTAAFTSLTNATAATISPNGNSGVILSATATALTQTLIAGTFGASADL